MKGVTVIEAVLIATLTISVAAAAIPWAYDAIQTSFDFSEVQTVRGDFVKCNEKLQQTARTGSTTNCLFNANKGSVFLQKDGIYYSIISGTDICSATDWVLIDPKNHIWQKCDEFPANKVFYLRWLWPKDINVLGNLEGSVLDESGAQIKQIFFNQTVTFRTLTIIVDFVYPPGTSGRFLEITRTNITADKATLSVKVT